LNILINPDLLEVLMTVFLTEKAAFRLRSFLRAEQDSSTDKGVRVGVIEGGCNGYEYALTIVNHAGTDDLIFEQDRVRIYVNPQSASLLDGVVIDFAESLTQSGFTFSNPNATNSCGCGKSFAAGDCTPASTPCS
jgi:iron-sulfur cluster assembly protein